jgi:hypothetical protein
VFVGVGCGVVDGFPEDGKRIAGLGADANLGKRRKRHAGMLMRSVARACPGQTFFVPSPLISEASEEQADLKIDYEELQRFNALVADRLEDEGITYIAQPLETIRENKWTKREFSVENNFRHMNARYGEIILRAIQSRLHP